METALQTFNPNNRPIYGALFLLLLLKIGVVSYFLEFGNMLSFIPLVILAYLFFIVSLMIVKNRTVFIYQDQIRMKYFRADLYLDLNVYNVTAYMKKNQVYYFHFESNQLTVKIYPSTYKTPDKLIKALEQAINHCDRELPYYSLT